jgi:predicted GNAT superfamily acetyltransferase
LEELAQLNEKEILKNVNINFLFAKGYNLVDSLIDMNRVYLVVNKIKELARQQAISGSKDINYDELVVYL